MQQACIDERVERNQLILHSDNGSPMKGATMLAKLESLGVVPSFSRPSVSDDNPFSEALFKTLKYRPAYPVATRFESVIDARQWVATFVDWYNGEHLHSGLKFITPNQRHNSKDKAILEQRHSVYQAAQWRRPDRWSGKTRNWTLLAIVTLNPDRKNSARNTSKSANASLSA